MQELDRRHVHQCAAKVATPSIANCETVACMSPTVAAPRLATLVGDLADARPAYRALADRIRLLIADGRAVQGVRLAGLSRQTRMSPRSMRANASSSRGT